jgi:hypothetical protein
MIDTLPIRRLVLIACLASTVSLAAVSSLHADEPQRLALHEWSVWVSEPTQPQINPLAGFPTSLPGLVDTPRSRRAEADRPNVAPLSMITLSGKIPDQPVDLSVRISNGRFLAHWPPAEVKNNRLAWNDNKLSSDTTDGAYGFVTDDHWFIQARKLNSLQIQRGARAERFFVYDPELNVPLSVRLEGGPDKYKVVNATKYPLQDVVVIAADAKGHRLGWIDELPGAKPAAPAKPAPGSSPAANAESKGATNVETKSAPATEAVGNAAPAAAAPIGPTAARPQRAAKGAATEAKATPEPEKPAVQPPETSADVEMGAPLGEEQFVTQATAELRKRLLAAGMVENEADLLLSLYANAFFKSKETVLLFRIPQGTIDEWLPIEVDPDTTKISRVALVLCFKVDPLIRDEVKQLVDQLADDAYAKREAAEQKLRDLGRMAIPALKEAAKSSDPERVLRAERLLIRQNEKLDGK